jgi:hypothetical protein
MIILVTNKESISKNNLKQPHIASKLDPKEKRLNFSINNIVTFHVAIETFNGFAFRDTNKASAS